MNAGDNFLNIFSHNFFLIFVFSHTVLNSSEHRIYLDINSNEILWFLQFSIKYKFCLIDDDYPIQNLHPRFKRNWPFRSSQQNANKINQYYRPRPSDGWFTRHIQKPFARYVGRAFGDEFPRVRDSIMSYQNQGLSFTHAHMPWTGYAPSNWVLNSNNDYQERSNPYNGYNPYVYGQESVFSHHPAYDVFRRNGKWNRVKVQTGVNIFLNGNVVLFVQYYSISEMILCHRLKFRCIYQYYW